MLRTHYIFLPAGLTYHFLWCCAASCSALVFSFDGGDGTAASREKLGGVRSAPEQKPDLLYKVVVCIP